MFAPKDYKVKDDMFWQMIESLPFEKRELLMHWPAYTRRREIPRFLAHYELFKQVVDRPGHVVELGVFRGASFFTWAKLMETFCTGDRSRKVYGFDWFKGLKDFSDKDGKDDRQFGKNKGGYGADAEILRNLVNMHNLDNMMPGVPRCHLIEGDIKETLPAFLEKNPGFRISLLHLDLDLYEPTLFALKHLYPLVVKGGVVAFDEYGLIPWEGESKAVEEYFEEALGTVPIIKKFPFSVQPHGYFIK